MSDPTPRVLPVAPSDEHSSRAPQAFVLAGGGPKRRDAEITEAPEPAEDGLATPPAAPPSGSWFSLSSLFWTALSLLVTLYLAEAAWGFVLSLQTKAPWLGMAALGLLGTVLLLGLVFVLRELLGIFRLRAVGRLREQAETVREKPAAERLLRDLSSFYASDATTAQARAEIRRVLGEIHDAETLVAVAERGLLGPKDRQARQLIAEAAQRVSLVTALSPKAIVDLAFVLGQSLVLIRRLSALYGGRASGIGLMRLGMRVLGHLVVTGGMAVADSAFGQIIGTGMAARLSAKLGEGVLNGVLTARVGIAALDLCRPLPFRHLPAVKLSEVVKISLTQEKVAENPAG
ncbi:MAG: TIGR01620 family protein [Beijerinckiaceae bacterium]|nr:TIGR01620 family protein [Beijerinckiaceae bacterium]MCZ8301264.1 TIGR01620 family protein [Beijerinckiaceae bacterium]